LQVSYFPQGLGKVSVLSTSITMFPETLSTCLSRPALPLPVPPPQTHTLTTHEEWFTCSNLKVLNKHFRLGRQEDAHEFLRCLIDAVQNQCLKVRSRHYNITIYIYMARLGKCDPFCVTLWCMVYVLMWLAIVFIDGWCEELSTQPSFRDHRHP